MRRLILRHIKSAGVISISLMAAIATIVGCAHSSSENTNGTAANEAGLLTQKLAESRSQIVLNVGYDLTVELDEKSPDYKGAVTTDFELRKVPEQLWLDFRGGNIERLNINGEKTTTFRREGSLLWLPTANLKKGSNRVTISFTQKYNTNGVGLHRFQDPADQEVYLYTQFEPYDASRFFPLFDQPDLRATLKLKVRAPKKWQIVTATDPERVSAEGDAYQFWNFKKTPAIASYLFSLHAGPYKEFKSTYANRVPLRLFIRKSLAEYLPKEDWFQWTRQGLAYFEKYFGVQYPFGKYDQLVVPEFNMGAMENVAAITFSERYIKRGQMTHRERIKLASVILHEMAHQWFGNLVTMKWWDDLWLNETFATYMAAKATEEAAGFKDSWIDFNDEKQEARVEDQMVSTHPIASKVENTDQAFNNFDGITYGKGAAVMKQFEYLIGPQAFQGGLQHYFKVHAYKNTTLRDFIGALQTKASIDLYVWARLWLEQSGIDTLTASVDCKSGSTPNLTLNVQMAPGRTFRPQSVEVAGFSLTPQKTLRRKGHQKVALQSLTQTVPFTGFSGCPDLVYVNYGDYGYLKTPASRADVEVLKKHLMKVEDTLTRQMIWTDLWEMVRDGQLQPATYAEIVLNNVRDEKEMSIYEFALHSMVGGHFDRSKRFYQYNNAFYYMPQATEGEKTAKRVMTGKAESLLLEILAKTPATSDKYKSTIAALNEIAQSERALNELYIRASQNNLDLDRRWDIAKALCRGNHPKAQDFKAELRKIDNSSRGEQAALACEASLPDVANKRKFLEQIASAGSNSPQLSGDNQKAIIRALIYDGRENMTAELAPAIKSFIKKDLGSRDEDFQGDFAEYLAPVTCEQSSIADFKKFIKSTQLSDVTAKIYKVSLQERERCMQLRKNAAATQTLN